MEVDLSELGNRILRAVEKRIVGMREISEKILVSLLCRGHVLLEGVPGLAKTMLARTIADCIQGVEFKRIQFTPDLLPADIVGSEVYNFEKHRFEVRLGPVFTNLLLADEVNRAPPKTQSALLECMQEKQVTIGGRTFRLEEPFMVMATQNPLEMEGVYPLPEAQVDRFLMKLVFTYPSFEEEEEIVSRYMSGAEVEVEPVTTKTEVLRAQDDVGKVIVPRLVRKYAILLGRSTRPEEKHTPQSVRRYVRWGVSPRAILFLVRCSMALAALRGRRYVLPEDVRYMVYDVFRHRVILTPEAELEGVRVEDVISDVVEVTPAPSLSEIREDVAAYYETGVKLE